MPSTSLTVGYTLRHAGVSHGSQSVRSYPFQVPASRKESKIYPPRSVRPVVIRGAFEPVYAVAQVILVWSVRSEKVVINLLSTRALDTPGHRTLISALRLTASIPRHKPLGHETCIRESVSCTAKSFCRVSRQKNSKPAARKKSDSPS